MYPTAFGINFNYSVLLLAASTGPRVPPPIKVMAITVMHITVNVPLPSRSAHLRLRHRTTLM